MGAGLKRAKGAGVAAGLALLALGCGDPDVEPEASAARLPVRESPEPEPAAPAPRAAPRLPAVGEATLHFEAGRLSVSANSAPRRPLLRELAAAAHFELVMGEGDWPPLTTSFELLQLRAALPRLVGDLAYLAEWRPGPREGHLLDYLEVGSSESSAALVGSDPRRVVAPAPYEGTDTYPVAETLAQVLEQRPLEDTPQDLLLERLLDSSPEVRMAAALEVDPEGEGLEKLAALLASDPDPGVRAAATTSLENTESFEAIRALVDALDDPNPEVVVQVINSLEFSGDETIVVHLTPLVAHPDPRVREAVADAIEFLGD